MAGNDLGGLLGTLLGSGSSSNGGNILGALLSALGKQGGDGGNPLGGLLDTLARSGLAEQKDSWLGSGENKSVTGPQIQQALPDDTLQQVAKEAGVSPERAADALAQELPQAVDRLTPNGEVPASLEELIRQQTV
ncbi:YidB family protein [Streptomyces justiciae]|uniref:YidB family protein n=1 Tax=Streptomyces justiciae TaxID=2780140 RepID=UPI002117975E|nr:YidB family protein [Streptomyces justiciae]MCW8380898.1 YidB family protein [Streptomyces justiciae]